MSDDTSTILAGSPYELEIITSDGIGYKIASSSFTLSFDAKNCQSDSELWLGESADVSNKSDFAAGSYWQRFNISYIYRPSYTGHTVKFKITKEGVDCEIDNIKLERGDTATAYSAYRGQGLIYEKLIPEYLGGEDRMSGDCFKDSDGDGFIEAIDGASSKCDDFVRFCDKKEVDCELYTSAKDRYSIPAKVNAFDYCPSECVGYDTFIQSKTVFDSNRVEYFIPTTAKTCGVSAVGCDEFTNLDKVELAGEEREYYTYLRQCQKPNASCADFYTWEGSNETGYQLKVFNLWDNNGDDEPDVTEDDADECNEPISNLSAIDPNYNSDCREFYNKKGEISYHLYTRTITCTDNCHPYRRTENNIITINGCKGECELACGDDAVCQNTCKSNCESVDCSDSSSDGLQSCQYDTHNSIFCKSSGYWNFEHNRCIYDAIPNQGVSCSAADAGCREYNGNEGSNMRILFTDDFESGDTQGWGGDLSAANPSNESIRIGGHSLLIEGDPYTATTTVGNLVQPDRSYVLKFIAKSNGATKLADDGIGFGTSAIDILFSTSSLELVNEWRLYKFNLARLNNEEIGRAHV